MKELKDKINSLISLLDDFLIKLNSGGKQNESTTRDSGNSNI